MPVPRWLTHTLALWPANSGMDIMDGWGWVVPASSGTPNSTYPLLTPRIWDEKMRFNAAVTCSFDFQKIQSFPDIFANPKTKIKFIESQPY